MREAIQSRVQALKQAYALQNYVRVRSCITGLPWVNVVGRYFKRMMDDLTLRDWVILVYTDRVLAQLENILWNPEAVNEAWLKKQLIGMLKGNWELIKGTVLCYTALPHNDVTKLLCRVASMAAGKTSGLSAIKMLMPTVNTDSLQPYRYKDLTTRTLEWIIKRHIPSETHQYLIPVRKLLTPENSRNPYFEYRIPGGARSFSVMKNGSLLLGIPSRRSI